MARNHKRAKRPSFTKTELMIIKHANDMVRPFGRVIALGPDAVGVLGDARAVGVAVLVKFEKDAKVSELSTKITNRVRGVARVLMAI